MAHSRLADHRLQGVQAGEVVSLRLELPWPHKDLSPNARVHWAVRSQRTSRARADARLLCRSAINAAGWPMFEGRQLGVSFTFCPADQRRRDLDNLISSTKAHRDGIADALEVDDSKFRLTAQMGPVSKGGKVIVEIA
jgi:crossover junction endodeoxyribonuclease RusA